MLTAELIESRFVLAVADVQFFVLPQTKHGEYAIICTLATFQIKIAKCVFIERRITGKIAMKCLQQKHILLITVEIRSLGPLVHQL